METWASIARLSIRKMSCLNGSRKLHFVQKISMDTKYSITLQIEQINQIICMTQQKSVESVKSVEK